jgi:putative oxidoreductase
MKPGKSIRSLILNTGYDYKIIVIRLIVSLIFISEGVQKYLFLQVLGPGLFQEIGFAHAYFWAYFTGAFEILCGILVLFGLLTRLASVPLVIVLITAFIKVKLPVLMFKGLFAFLHEYNTDFALILLLSLLIIYGGGRWSVDLKLFSSKKP